MADTKLSALSELSVMTLDDKFYVVDDPAGTPASYSQSATRAFGLASPLCATGRLTLANGNAGSFAPGNSSTLYYTDITNDGDDVTTNQFSITLYDGTRLRLYRSSQISLSLTLTSGKNYDVFIYDNAGTLTLELSAAWTNDTTRADNLAAQSGLVVKSGATTRRWVGTIRASASNQTTDSVLKRFVWNAYNQIPRLMYVNDATANWSYSTTTWRQANGNSANKLEFVLGYGSTPCIAELKAGIYAVNNNFSVVSIGANSTSTPDATATIGTGYSNDAVTAVAYSVSARYEGVMNRGYNFFAWVERGSAGTTSIFLGDVDNKLTAVVWG